MVYLTKQQIIKINKLTTEYHGGNFNEPDNFLHESSLEYLVDAVHSKIFDQEMYPTIYEKAGVYLYNLIANHIFSDGNKRTGLEACLIFLKLNQYQLNSNVSNQILTDFIISIASAEQSLDSVQEWIKANVMKKSEI
jgi:death-on-curing protein